MCAVWLSELVPEDVLCCNSTVMCVGGWPACSFQPPASLSQKQPYRNCIN